MARNSLLCADVPLRNYHSLTHSRLDMPLKYTKVPMRFRAAIAKVRYRKNPHMQNSMRKLKVTLTLVLTLTDTGGGAVLTLILGYRSLNTLHGNSGHLR